MNEERSQDSLNLIEALLRCPRGREAQILSANLDLIDSGLVEVIAQLAKGLAERDGCNTADSLIHFACKLAEIHFAFKLVEKQGLSSSTPIGSPHPAFVYRLPLVLAVLQVTTESDGNPEVVYRLLQANLNKLDDTTAVVLHSWATAMLAVLQPEEAQSLASYIGKFSVLIAGFPLGIQANNLEIAIAGYKMARQAYNREAFPEEWAKIQNNLGIAYTNRIRGERAENLEEAIACCQAALDVLTREASSQEWAMAQNNLANAYLDRIRGERTQNLEEAIACCQAALQVYNRDVFPQEWAAVQHNLGSAYYDRIQEERTQNLEKAIACYRGALEVRTREAFPPDWAMTQNNLGTAYRDRIDGERAENIEKAITCHQAALQVYNRAAFPQEWAMAQSNLGNAYTNRIRGERVQNLKQGIICCQAALEVLKREEFPQYWAMTQNNLGIAYWDRIDGERDQNLEKAITCYQAALDVCTREAFPFDWAMIQHNLGIAYHDRIQGERTQNLEKAIACYQAALEVRIRKAFPQYCAMTQHNLGIAYHDRIRGERTQNLEEAIACYQAALEVRTREAFPKNYAETQFHLGRAYQDTRQFTKAYTAFRVAIDTVESLRNEIVSGSGIEGDKQKLAEKYNQIYQRIVEVCLELAKYEPKYYNQALEYIERSKARNLVELLINKNFSPKPDLYPNQEAYQTHCDRLDQLRREIPTKQRQLEVLISSRESLQHLAEILHIDDILSHIDDIFERKGARCDRLILIPHRYLHLFPLHALPLADGNLLLDRFPNGVGYAPSCQLLKLAKDQEQYRSHFSRLFAIQNPSRSRSKPLLGSKLEVDRIRQHFDPDHSIVLAEAEATEVTLTQRMNQLRSAHCVHFSCHGVFKPESPLESALLLADPEDKLGADANLTLGKIFEKLYLNQCRLVTFSACESGMTDPTSISDEYIGLPSGFLYAGSVSIVSTLWTVDPLATTLLMVKFYKNLKRFPELEAGDVALALKKAQTWLRTLTSKKLARIPNNPKFQRWVEQAFENLSKRDRKKFNELLDAALKREPYPFANPYYWSCFVATGL
jgi:CHAT domain-containing protein